MLIQIKRYVFLIAIIIMASVSANAHAQDSNTNANSSRSESATNTSSDSLDSQSVTKPDFNQTFFFAFLEEDPNAPNGPVYDYLKDKPFIRDIIVPHNAMERKFRPMMQWRAWAEKPQGFVASTLFIALVSFVCSWLFPKKIKEAARECRTNFWKSFGSGSLIAIVWTILTRSIFLTEIGWPLGVVLNALFQAAMLGGFSVVVLLLGSSLNAILKIHRLEQLNEKPAYLLVADLLVGSISAALILQIPGFGDIPRIGARLIALFAVLGLGSIYRIRANKE